MYTSFHSHPFGSPQLTNTIVSCLLDHLYYITCILIHFLPAATLVHLGMWFCHKTTYTWPPPEINGKACFDRVIFTQMDHSNLQLAHSLVEMIDFVCTLNFFLARFCD